MLTIKETKKVKEDLLYLIKNNSKSVIHLNIDSWLESEDLEIEKGKNKKIIFQHSLFGLNTGFSERIIHSNHDYKYSFAENLPDEFLYLHSIEPLKYFSEIQRNGTNKDKNIKKNKFHIGTIMNAQTMDILATKENIKNLKVYSSLMTNSGEGFYKSIGINPTKFIFKGISFDELYDKSLEAAIKVGYKF